MGKGIWLGHARDSNEIVVGTPDGAYRAYAIKRMVEEERWDSEFIRSLQGTPQQPDPRRRGTTVPISFRFEAKAAEVQVQPAKEMAEPASRRRGITQTDLDKYGLTPGCPGCLAKQRGEIAKRGHSEACRRRIEGMMKDDVDDRRKIEASEERITHHIARRIEREERKRKAGEEDSGKQEFDMQDEVEESKEEEKAPAKKVRTIDDGTDENTSAGGRCRGHGLRPS